jgi:hypothetical protein
MNRRNRILFMALSRRFHHANVLCERVLDGPS